MCMRVPVPRMGGVAIFLSVIAMAVLLRSRAEFVQLSAILLGAAMMSFLGLIDDRFQLNAYIKLIVQLGVAVFAWYAGMHDQHLSDAAAGCSASPCCGSSASPTP